MKKESYVGIIVVLMVVGLFAIFFLADFKFTGFVVMGGNSSVVVDLISPQDELQTDQNHTFICNGSSLNELSNVTFYIWNSSSSQLYSETKNIVGVSNTSEFEYNFLYEDTYEWNCLFVDNLSFGGFADLNFSVVYNITKPDLILISPSDDYSTTDTSISFKYNVSDEINVTECSLILNNESVANQSEINLTNTISYSVSVGSYIWEISCNNNGTDIINSSVRTLAINEEEDDDDDDSSNDDDDEDEEEDEDGGSDNDFTIPVKTYVLTDNQIANGTHKSIRVNDKMKFKIDEDEHILTLKSISSDKATIIISSNPITLILDINQTKKADIDDDGYYDLETTLLSIVNARAEIEIKKIHEKIPESSGNQEEDSTADGKSPLTGSVVGEEQAASYKLKIFGAIVLVVLLGLAVSFIIKKKFKFKDRKQKLNFPQ